LISLILIIFSKLDPMLQLAPHLPAFTSTEDMLMSSIHQPQLFRYSI
jgi:hypothetical protein